MTLLPTVFLVSFVSALVPLVNAEAYLAWAASVDGVPLVATAAVASAGQVVGKLGWYYAGNLTLRASWLQRRLARRHRAEVVARWQARTRGRPALAGALMFVSAVVGVPPYLVAAAVAGALGVSLRVFLVTGLVGRFLRFWLVLEVASWGWSVLP